MTVARQLLGSVGGIHGLAVVAVLLAITVLLAVLLHWSVASIGLLTLLGVVLRRVMTYWADARDAHAGLRSGESEQRDIIEL